MPWVLEKIVSMRRLRKHIIEENHNFTFIFFSFNFKVEESLKCSFSHAVTDIAMT